MTNTETTPHPALLTLGEYYEKVNPNGKWHPSSAYRFSIEERRQQNQTWKHEEKSSYPELIRRMSINGLMFEFRLKRQDRWASQYVKCDPETEEPLRDELGQVIYHSRQEIENGAIPGLLKRRWNYSIGIFTDEDGYIGGSDDEWGCMLVRIADEYRGFGLGPILGKMARELEPYKPSGGFTCSGEKNFIKIHREFVREYLVTGRYRQMIQEGKIKLDRARQIISSADLSKRLPSKTQKNLATSNPSDWLLFSGGYGDFIVYDRKLADLMATDNQWSYWTDKMIIGGVYVAAGERFGRIKMFGGETDGIRKFLMTLAASHTAGESVDLVVEPEDLAFVDRSRLHVFNDKPTLNAGYHSHIVRLTQAIPDIKPLLAYEATFRRKFDKCDEFKNNMIEMAYAKFRPAA